MTGTSFNPAAQGTEHRYLIVVDYNGMLVNSGEGPDDLNQVNLRRAVVEAAQYGHKVILASEFHDEDVQREFLEIKLRGIVAGNEAVALFMHNRQIVTTYAEIQADPEAALGAKAASIYVGPRGHEDDVPHAQPGEISRPDISQRLRHALNMKQLPGDEGFVPNVAQGGWTPPKNG